MKSLGVNVIMFYQNDDEDLFFAKIEGPDKKQFEIAREEYRKENKKKLKKFPGPRKILDDFCSKYGWSWKELKMEGFCMTPK